MYAYARAYVRSLSSRRARDVNMAMATPERELTSFSSILRLQCYYGILFAWLDHGAWRRPSSLRQANNKDGDEEELGLEALWRVNSCTRQYFRLHVFKTARRKAVVDRLCSPSLLSPCNDVVVCYYADRTDDDDPSRAWSVSTINSWKSRGNARNYV